MISELYYEKISSKVMSAWFSKKQKLLKNKQKYPKFKIACQWNLFFFQQNQVLK
jgi:hypothetical protein